MQRYTTFFIAVSAVHVSGVFSAHHQELKTVHTAWAEKPPETCTALTAIKNIE
jgi:hypothetical protein